MVGLGLELEVGSVLADLLVAFLVDTLEYVHEDAPEGGLAEGLADTPAVALVVGLEHPGSRLDL